MGSVSRLDDHRPLNPPRRFVHMTAPGNVAEAVRWADAVGCEVTEARVAGMRAMSVEALADARTEAVVRVFYQHGMIVLRAVEDL